MSKSLIEKKNDLITRAEEVLAKAKEEERELTDAEMAELAEIRDNVRKIVKSLGLEDEINELSMEKKEEKEEMNEDKRELEEQRAIEVKEAKEFEKFIRNNERGNLSPASGSGQVLVPVTIADRIMKRVYQISPILERATKYTITGKLSVPYYSEDTTDKINVAYATEFTALTANVGKFTSIDLDGFLIGALAKVGRTLINRTTFDIVGFVVNQMAESIKVFLEKELLKGTTNKIAGLSGVTNIKTTASATVITADELIDLQDMVIDDYQQNAIWIMSPATRTTIRKLQDQEHRYLLQDDISAPFGKTLLGKPVYVSDNMDNIAGGKTVVYYGDMSGLSVKFAEEMSVDVLREAFATEHAVGVVGWIDVDGKVTDQQKLAKLVMHTA